MRVDIYRREEPNSIFSYLAVPEGKLIPEEATNTDWQQEASAVELDEELGQLSAYHIDQAVEQIDAKGYAITALREMGEPPHPHS